MKFPPPKDFGFFVFPPSLLFFLVFRPIPLCVLLIMESITHAYTTQEGPTGLLFTPRFLVFFFPHPIVSRSGKG